MTEFFSLILAGAVIASPVAVLEMVSLIRQRRRGTAIEPIMFCQMEAGKAYRVRVRDQEVSGKFAQYIDDCAIFANGEFIRRTIIDEVEVIPL